MGIDTIGRIGKVLNHSIDKFIEIISETRKGFNQKAFLYNSSGEDSPPVKDDRIILLKIDGTGKYVVAGILTESQGAKPGEKIFFSRNASGEIQSKISMLEDGTVNGEIKKDLTLTIKGDFTTSADGNISEEAKGNKDIKAISITITGDTEIILKTIGSDLWFPNCVPTCPFGFPHGGAPGGITGLKGS